ncbi:MAG: hypothetical protein ABI347_03010 [Nitrososphaera sp.]
MERVNTYHLTMDDEKCEIKPETLFKIYAAIESQAKQAAPPSINQEIRIAQDGKIKTRFYITVSDRMAPHLVAAVQKQIGEYGVGLKSYFYKLQEQLMAQMFAGAKDTISISLR